MSFKKSKETKSSDFDYNAAKQFLKNRELKKIRRNKQLYKKANSECKKIIKMIIEKYNPKRIYQWGSLLYPERFSEISDIDIAVEGIDSAETFFKLYGDAYYMTKFSLDLVEIEKVHPLHAESIQTRGKIVYERR